MTRELVFIPDVISAKLLVAALVAFIGAVASDQAGELSPAGPVPKYILRHWTVDDGLPQNTVNCVLQTTRDGYLWIGTKDGLARYDGMKFTTFREQISAGDLDDLNCRQLVEDTEGSLWIRTGSRLIRLRDGVFTFYPVKLFLADQILTMNRRQAGGIWVGTNEGLFLLHNGEVTKPIHDPRLQHPGYVYEDRGGTLWVQSNEYLWRVEESTGRVTNATEFFGLTDLYPVSSIFQDSHGAYWVSTQTGLFFFAAGRWQKLPQDEPLASGWSTATLCEDRTGAYWLGTYTCVRRLHNGHSVVWDKDQGMPDDDIRCVYEDREGSLWMGTGGHGLFQLRMPAVQTFTKKQGLSADDVQSLCPRAAGGVWTSPLEGLEMTHDGQVKVFAKPLSPPLAEGILAPLFEDRTGKLWFGVGHHGLFVSEGQSALPQKLGPAAPEKTEVTAILEDRSGSLWVGTTSGLFCRTNAEFRRFDHAEGLPHEHTTGLCETPDGSLWIGTFGGGVAHLINGKFHVLSTNDHLLSNFASPLFAETNGAIWISTPKGLNRIRNGIIASVTTHEGLFDNSPFCMIPDASGRFWFNSRRGIFHVTQDELRAVADRQKKTLNCISYGRADGVMSSEGNGEFQPNACKTADGKIWFCTTKGVVMVDPERILENKPPPPVVIEQARADGELIINPKLGPGRGRFLEIHYTANSFWAPEQVRFRYKLEGHDDQWREVMGRERTALYHNLRPGRYTFLVTACNNHGVWNDRPGSFNFSILPRFTETAWFPASLVLGGASAMLALAIWRLRWQRRTAHAERLAAIERERARIARDLHDDLGSSLTGIALELEAAHRRGKAEGEQLQTIAGEARSLAHQLRELAWTTNPRCDNLASLGSFLGEFTERACQARGLNCQLQIPGADQSQKVSARIRHELLMVVKESLANVARHAAAKNVSMKVELTREEVSLTLTDDGAGFNPLQRPGGTGLRNLRERVEQLGGRFSIDSAPRRGTTITASLPLEVEPNA